MRLDHIAYRTKDRQKTANFFINAFGYKIQQEFDIDLGEGNYAKCIALEPSEKISNSLITKMLVPLNLFGQDERKIEYHLAPEIFVSDGNQDSIIGKWVAKRDGIGGIHHLAYEVKSVKEIMVEWKEKGFANFLTEEPLKCPESGLVQVFTEVSTFTGIIYEFIERSEYGFCKANVKNLILSSDKDNKYIL